MVESVLDLLLDDEIEIILPTHETFLRGAELSAARLDKGYSLTDCPSLNLMRARGITDVLTHDHHYTQEGLNILL